MTDPIRTAALLRDQDAVTPSAEKRAQAASLTDLGKEFISLVGQIGKTREGSIAITKMEEALHWGVSHVLNTPESGSAS